MGGKGHGTLKKATIVKLSSYYKKAIYDNMNNVSAMKQSILATLHHAISTDTEPRHEFCPTGKESWCFFQRASANGEKVGSHNENVGTALKPELYEKIKPIYDRLSDEDLLNRCANCLTQNANESLHHMIWNRCPKEKFYSKQRIEIACAITTSEFNFGVGETMSQLQKELGLKVGIYSEKISNIRDCERLKQNDETSTVEFKKSRKRKQMSEIKSSVANKKKNEITYKAGAF